MKLNKVILLSASLSVPAFGGVYETMGTLGQYSTDFSRASTAPTDSIQVLSQSSYVYAQRLQLQSEFSLSDVDSFVDDLERLEDEVERVGIAPSDAKSIIDDFDGRLASLGDAEALEFHSKVYFPYFPISFKTGNHYISSFFEVEAGASLDFLDAPLAYNSDDETLVTESAGRLKTYTHTSFGLDYATHLIKQKEYALDGGIRLNAHHVGLYKELRAFDAQRDEDIENLVLDDYKDIVETSLKFGIDATLRFENKEGVVVLGVRNINEPVFDYNKVSTYCSLPEYASERDCVSANHFVSTGEINDGGQIKMYRQAYAQATHIVPFWDLRVSGYLEANKTRDLLRDWTQIARGEISYDCPESWVTSAFLAYEKNLVGDKEERIVGGLSLFNRVQCMGYSSTSMIEEDGRTMPEDFGFSISVNTNF